MCFSPKNQNYVHSENDEYPTDNHHYSISSRSPVLLRKINQEPLSSNNDNDHTNIPLSSSKVKWIGAVRTVTQLNQVRHIRKKKETNVD